MLRLKIFIIFLGIAVSPVISLTNSSWYPRTSNKNCLDPLTKGYCEDCRTAVICDGGGGISLNTTCTEGNLCNEQDEFSSCISEDSVPLCQCPSSDGIVTVEDPYNNQKFLLCNDGSTSFETCPDDGYFNPETGKCQDVTVTTTTSAPPLSSCDGQFDLIAVSCTTYKICHTDETTSGILPCESGEIFDDVNNECTPFLPFSCPSETGSNLYGDNHNCSLFYLCSGGEIQGEPFECPEGEVFSDDLHACTTNAESCSALPDCGICPDGVTTLPVGECKRYYQCTEVEGDNGSSDFTPVLKECPGDLNYNPEEGYCDFNVEGCP